MENQNLRNQLVQLKSELSGINASGDRDRELLRKLQDDINQILSRESRDHTHEAGFVARLKDAASRFEASHAGATMLMGELAAGLANLGL